jgi:hypothetical protein
MQGEKMRKYYTIDKITSKAYKENRIFELEHKPSDCLNYKNTIRMFFGLKPKLYYFVTPKEIRDDEMNKAKLDQLKAEWEEIDEHYRW